MATKVLRCSRCKRRQRTLDGWNGVFRDGVLVAVLCPDCQTPEENAEAEIHAATLDYHCHGGPLYGKAKAS